MDARGKRNLQKLKDRERPEYMEQPSYDTTKDTSPPEREKALSFTGPPITHVSVQFIDDKIMYSCPLGQVKQSTVLRNGDVRKVMWTDGNYYKARITDIKFDGTVMVIFLSDRKKLQVTFDKIQGHSSIAPGDIRDVKWKNGRWYAARILKIANTSIDSTTRRPTSSRTMPAKLPEPQQSRITPKIEYKNNLQEDESVSTSLSISLTSSSRTRPPVIYKNTFEDEELLDFSADESEYYPDEHEANYHDKDTSGEEEDLFTVIAKDNNPHEVPVADAQPSTVSCPPRFEINEVKNAPTLPIPLKIDMAKKSVGGKRKWDRKYYCKYCKLSYPKLPRHLESKHAHELEVASFLALPKGNANRNAVINKIRIDGERIKNFKTYSSHENEGLVIPKRRPTEAKNVKDFLPCEYCGMLMSKTYLSRHVKACVHRPSTPSEVVGNYTYNRVRARCAMLLPTAPNVSDEFKERILQKMTYDDVYCEIIGDEVILAFGTKLFENKMRRPSQYREVKDRMRELARLLICVKSMDKNVNSLADLIDATKYNTIVKAAKNVAGFDKETGKYVTPSLVIKIGQSLMKCSFRYKGLCMDDEVLHEQLPKIELFQERMRENWTDDATKDAHTTIQERKWNAPQRLPMSEDVRKLNIFLTEEDASLLEEFNQSKSYYDFRRLCENTLCRLILLNRRRVGETQFMKLSDYNKSKLNSNIEDSEIMMTLSETEKVLVKSLQRIEVRGKRGRMVPVILTKSLQNTIKVLIEARQIVGVPDSNDFLFPALHSCTGHYRADVLLRNAAYKSNAVNPETLTGTQLRKHVATMVQLLNLRENELDAVANYLGHDIRVHRQYYRLPHDAMQLAKVSKLLLNMESNNVNKMRGMNLDEIVVDDNIYDREDNVADDDEDVTESVSIPPVPPHGSTFPEKVDSLPIQVKKTLKRKVKDNGAPPKRQMFSNQESQKIKSYFKSFIEVHRVPTVADVNQFYITHPDMNQVNWTRIKMHVYNCFASRTRK